MTVSELEQLSSRFEMSGVIKFNPSLSFMFSKGGRSLKLFGPRSIRMLGGQPGHRRLGGYLGFVLQDEMPSEVKSGKMIAPPSSFSVISIENLPKLVEVSIAVGGEPAASFVSLLKHYLSALPNDRDSVGKALGDGFLDLSPLDRMSRLANFLRAVPVAC